MFRSGHIFRAFNNSFAGFRADHSIASSVFSLRTLAPPYRCANSLKLYCATDLEGKVAPVLY